MRRIRFNKRNMTVLMGTCLLAVTLSCTDKASPMEGVPITPAWALGHIVWEDEFNTQEAVLRLVDGYREHDIPVNGVIIDSPWTLSYNDFQWDRNLYPQPDSLLQELKARGIHTLLWLTGNVNTKSNDCPVDKAANFDEAVAKGYGVNGSAVYEWWKGEGIHIDFTNPEATAWWYGQVDRIMTDGIDGFKVDQGETYLADRIDTSIGRLSNAEFRPYYYDAMYDYVNSRRPGTGVILARPYSHQAQGNYASRDKLSVGWCGDFHGDWAGLKKQIADIYRSAQEGYGAIGTEIGGYYGTPPNKAQLIRYAQFGAMTATMINGGGHGPFENHLPWWHDVETEEIYRNVTNLHIQLVPYIFSTLVDGVLIQHVDTVEESHMLGPDLFTKAITNDDTHVTFHLPADGEWVDWTSGKLYQGGTLIDREYPLDEFPLFVRRGSIIPMQTDKGITLFITPSDTAISTTLHLPTGEGTDYEDCPVTYDPKKGVRADKEFIINEIKL